MSDAAANSGPPAPDVDPSALKEIAPGVFVITDRRIPLVPNIGIIVGKRCGAGRRYRHGPGQRPEGARLRQEARRPAAFDPDAHAFPSRARLWRAGFQRHSEDLLQSLAARRAARQGRRLSRHVQDLRPECRGRARRHATGAAGRCLRRRLSFNRSRRPHGRAADLGPRAYRRRSSGVAAAGAHPVHRRPRRGADVSDLSVVSARRRRHQRRALGGRFSPS